ncbi:SRPBCC domain-containing protein [Bacillus sp. DNRA2]|uniref:SRPBCC family protein n=1 Tax=Bacillus sp. DNRA2 TaxID=2723053 RepID=UPI00145C58E1|nr:SRPBCC domain-containing protein [Bacillus sp. DNRA2]NMD71104.1 SRPBCC domain-containing protein [Bacillus sp. DNRA2]
MENTLQDIQQSVIINAPIEKVWEKVSSAEGISAWFMPNDFKPEVGYEFHIQSPFGPSPCKVTELSPPHRLSFTWDTDGWILTFILKELGEQTEFTVVHGGWKQADEIIGKAGEKAGTVRENMSKGWMGIVQKLRQQMEN